MFGLIAGIILGSCTILESPIQNSDCKIKDVLSVRGPISFVCRADNFPGAGPARLYVTLRGIEVPQDLALKAQMELQSRLEQARSIRLRNIEMGSYFRIQADAEVDGKDLAGILIAKGLARKIELSESVKNDTQSAQSARPEVKFKPASTPKPASSRPGSRVVMTDWGSLMERQVDLSSITPMTPFREALEQVCTSIEPTIPIMINWNDLRQNAFVEETSLVGVDGLGRIGIGQAMELICNAVDSGRGQVSFVQRGRVLVVASRRSIGNPVSLRVIDVSELTAPPSTGMGMNSMNGGYGSGYGMGNTMGNQLGGTLSNMNLGSNRP